MCHFSGRPVRINDRALSLFPVGLYQDSESTGQVAEQGIAAPVSNSSIPGSDWVTGWTAKGFIVRFRIRTSILKRICKIALGTSVCPHAKSWLPLDGFFFENWYLRIFSKIWRKILFRWRYDQNSGYFKWTPMWINDNISLRFFLNEKYFRQKL
jgi:hypothetical protein